TARYFYRKRVDGNSTLDKKLKDKRYFLDVSSRGYLALLEYTQNELGYIPNFIQQTIIYDVCWMVKDIVLKPLKVIKLKEYNEFMSTFKKIFSFIDENSLNNSILSGFLKIGILNKFKDLQSDTCECELEKYTNEYLILSYYYIKDSDNFKVFINNQECKVDFVKIKQINFFKDAFVYKKIIYIKNDFKIKNIEVFLNGKKLKIKDKSFYKIKQLFYKRFISTNITNEGFEFYKFLNGDTTLNINENIYKSIKERLFCKDNELWLFADRKYKANDNAEYFYEYVKNNHPKQKIAFVIDKKSNDFKRLKNKGFNVVSSSGFCFKLTLFRAKKIISSHTDTYLLKGLGKHTLFNKDYIFLQHGVTKDNISNWLNSKDISLIITSTTDEYNSIVSDYSDYKLSSKEVVLTGMPRFEKLIEKSRVINQEKMILIFPTWREYLASEIDKKTYKRKKNDNFYNSLYYKNYKELLVSKELEYMYKNSGYKVVFIPHFAMLEYLDDFKLSSYIEVINMQDIDIQEYLCKASVLITDYSSIAFDFALLKKKIIYFQFDEEEQYNHIYNKGYFDYYKHGFGKVCIDLVNLYYVKNN
ncbi:CDP-glycerol glycerophosphotransferase family protein, partial [Campylobacter sp. RM12640]|uniref:CDP-glycerol glycerophosphotransferase family protein n=1 Tax=unclassified Campylobacter TaxID=2593542 RepID=UPI00301537F5|nr:CDP-glycerol glycerophosphotransferase family protein [Campylobacter sp. RM12640]MBZ7990019.1 CDP-glycerol glycerophosphotransferase family protein [Campylobacter sp. RM12635]